MQNLIMTICLTSIPWAFLVGYLWHKLSKLYSDEQFVMGLIRKLANVEANNRFLKSSLSKQYSENERLTSEKLRKWGIPDHI